MRMSTNRLGSIVVQYVPLGIFDWNNPLDTVTRVMKLLIIGGIHLDANVVGLFE